MKGVVSVRNYTFFIGIYIYNILFTRTCSHSLCDSREKPGFVYCYTETRLFMKNYQSLFHLFFDNGNIQFPELEEQFFYIGQCDLIGNLEMFSQAMCQLFYSNGSILFLQLCNDKDSCIIEHQHSGEIDFSTITNQNLLICNGVYKEIFLDRCFHCYCCNVLSQLA